MDTQLHKGEARPGMIGGEGQLALRRGEGPGQRPSQAAAGKAVPWAFVERETGPVL